MKFCLFAHFVGGHIDDVSDLVTPPPWRGEYVQSCSSCIGKLLIFGIDCLISAPVLELKVHFKLISLQTELAAISSFLLSGFFLISISFSFPLIHESNKGFRSNCSWMVVSSGVVYSPALQWKPHFPLYLFYFLFLNIWIKGERCVHVMLKVLSHGIQSDGNIIYCVMFVLFLMH